MKIDTPIEYNIRIPDVYGNFVVSVANNVAIISPEQVYSEKDHGIKIATVRSTFHSVIRNYDARTFGGGLPDDQKDNYNLLDISHINGRPYRKGGDVVITLPKAVESHHEIVDKAVSKHISSGDRHIIIYE